MGHRVSFSPLAVGAGSCSIGATTTDSSAQLTMQNQDNGKPPNWVYISVTAATHVSWKGASPTVTVTNGLMVVPGQPVLCNVGGQTVIAVIAAVATVFGRIQITTLANQ